MPQQTAAGAPEVPAVTDDAWRPVLTRWVRRWGAADRRSRWLAAHALVAVHGPAAAGHADRLIAHLTAPPPEPRSVLADRPPKRSRQPASSTQEPGWPAAPDPEADDAMLLRPDPSRIAGEAAPHGAPGDAPADTLPVTEADWQPSRHGGLLLLLPALARLELAEADPEGDLCLALLHRIGDRLKIRSDDAIRRALPKPLPRTASRAFVPPDAWRSLMRLPCGADLGREDCLLAVCHLALARFLRRHAKISPCRLIRRPALVHATPTHIDLCFDARWVELEVRLAGLDLDPGWVPWLGRVVSFHYAYEGLP